MISETQMRTHKDVIEQKDEKCIKDDENYQQVQTKILIHTKCALEAEIELLSEEQNYDDIIAETENINEQETKRFLHSETSQLRETCEYLQHRVRIEVNWFFLFL